jgi:hypothetical protein
MMLLIKKLLYALTITTLIGCSSSYKYVDNLVKEPSFHIKKTVAIKEDDSFIPEELRNISNDNEIDDFILYNLVLNSPDTIDDSNLYNRVDPVFAPKALDSGVLFCNRDAALYINDKAWNKYLQVEVETRKEFEKQFIKTSINAEDEYKEAISFLIKEQDTLHNAYINERSRKETWKNISFGTTLILLGFILNGIAN